MARDVLNLSDLVQNWLQGDSSEAVAIQATLLQGKDSIFESGKLTRAMIQTAEQYRIDNPALAHKAMFIIVQHAGDDILPRGVSGLTYYCLIRILDRNFGYENIGATADLIKKQLRYPIGNAAATLGGVGDVKYLGSVGHRYDPVYGLEYDALSVSGIVIRRSS